MSTDSYTDGGPNFEDIYVHRLLYWWWSKYWRYMSTDSYTDGGPHIEDICPQTLTLVVVQILKIYVHRLLHWWWSKCWRYMSTDPYTDGGPNVEDICPQTLTLMVVHTLKIYVSIDSLTGSGPNFEGIYFHRLLYWWWSKIWRPICPQTLQLMGWWS